MKDLRFNFTDEMADILLNILNIKEKLEEKSITKDEKNELERKFIELRELFIKEFQKNNKEEITKYNECKHTIN